MPDVIKIYHPLIVPVPPASGSAPLLFERRMKGLDVGLLTDTILPPGVLLEFAAVDVLNCFINYVELHAVITERDPEEDERHISISNRFYTHFHEFGTVIHVVASSPQHWWYFCYDIDQSEHSIGRIEIARATLPQIIAWVHSERISKRYPVVDIDVQNIQGWRSFQ
jgi:hypothetical protein